MWVVWPVASVCLAAVAWLLGSRVQSPEQAAADAQPPEPSVITAAIVHERLSDSFVVNGEVVAPDSLTVPAARLDGVSAVVLEIVSAGEVVGEGSVLVVVSGRPILLLGGSFPLYRDLQRGLEGPDVVMVQEALARLGHFEDDIDGVFGSETEQAVAALYDAVGFEPAEPDGAMPGPRRPVLRLPAGEVMVVDGLPAVVIQVGAATGDRVDEGSPLLVLAQGDPVVSLTVRGARSGAVAIGMPVRVFIDALGLATEGVVVTLGEQEADFAEGISREVFVTVDGLIANHVGMAVRAVMATQETEDAVLAVPVGAVFTEASGATTVVALVDGSEVAIPISPGRVIGGFVELVDADPRLTPGLLVVVGWR
jgi:peptidoglycan hydrolase-like protein with peptidoglycan-binding domain